MSEDDMHLPTRSAPAWKLLRTYRAHPPATVRDNAERRQTFVSALWRMEDLFHRALTLPPAARTLPLLYGLCWAGRAIAASAPSLTGADWRLASHGLRSFAVGPAALPDLVLVTDSPGSASGFTRVSEILRSPVWGGVRVQLEDVWDGIPVNLDHPLSSRDRTTPLYVDGDVGDGHNPLLTVAVCDIPRRVVRARSRQAFEQHLASFPGTARCHGYTCRGHGEHAIPAFSSLASGRGGLRMSWLLPQSEAHTSGRLRLLHSMTHAYGTHRYFLPVAPPLHTPLHPLMAWWAVLCGLATLVHTHGAAWLAYTGPGGSSTAVAHLLRQGPRDLPLLVADALGQTQSAPARQHIRS
ncbi:hypothetical protein AB0M39_31695 [Streptomyces sp. NPDC051907]|uniref:YaaC family protein n=1 Tax=Streptomyces sp. NPDC051907 TaxID=3155284 RepID=UPI00342C3143